MGSLHYSLAMALVRPKTDESLFKGDRGVRIVLYLINTTKSQKQICT